MATENLKVDIVKDWQETSRIRTGWQELSAQSLPENPFASHDWFDCWYQAYCDPKEVRVIVVRDTERIRAIIPGFLNKRSVAGLPLTCFSYAANGHTPRGGIIVRQDDVAAARIALRAVFDHLDATPHLCVFPAVDKASATGKMIGESLQACIHPHVEHSYEAPAFAMPQGWEEYLSKKSSNTRGRLNQSLSRTKKFGPLDYQMFSEATAGDEVVARLKVLDAKTWQGKNNTGLFSTQENNDFYSRLLAFKRTNLPVFVCILTLGGQDVAYSLATHAGQTAFFLKYGYDPEFGYCRPGVLTMAQMGKHAASLRMIEVDLGGGVNDDKERWETHRRQYENYWLINKKTFKGNALVALLKVHRQIKNMQQDSSH